MPNKESSCCAEVSVLSVMGLHARPAAQIVNIVAKYDATVQITVADDSSRSADASSVLELLILAAVQNTRLLIQAEGAEAPVAVKEISGYFKRCFDEK